MEQGCMTIQDAFMSHASAVSGYLGLRSQSTLYLFLAWTVCCCLTGCGRQIPWLMAFSCVVGLHVPFEPSIEAVLSRLVLHYALAMTVTPRDLQKALCEWYFFGRYDLKEAHPASAFWGQQDAFSASYPVWTPSFVYICLSFMHSCIPVYLTRCFLEERKMWNLFFYTLFTKALFEREYFPPFLLPASFYPSLYSIEHFIKPCYFSSSVSVG